MDEKTMPSQKEVDEGKQRRLTERVGVRLERQEKSTTSSWAGLKRLLRIG